MKAKDYLMQVKKIDAIINNKMIEKEQWKSIATSTSSFSDGDRVQSSGSQQKMADAVCRYVEIDREIDSYIDMLVDSKKEIINTIELLNATEYDILHKMYIGIIERRTGSTKYLEMDEVADAKGKSYTWATTVHGRAIKHVQDILNERG